MLYFLQHSKLFKIVIAIFYIISEFEMLIQFPNDFIIFRKIYFYLIRIKIGKKSYIGKNAILYRAHQISIGNYASIGENCMLHAHANIKIGDNFLAAPGLTINSGGHNLETLQPISKEIIIGNNVWCGLNVVILSGVTIGNNVVIGAGAVVTKNVASNVLVAGNPAKVLKNINRTEEIWTWHNSKCND